MKHRQRGLATVEFAIIGVVLMVVLFGIIEMGRALFVMNTLAEVTRRAARVATVCPVDSPGYATSIGAFAAGGGSSRVIAGLTPANIMVEYLDPDGAVVPDPTTSTVGFVRARLVNFTLDLAIPFILPSIPMPPFSATLPAESLGFSQAGVLETCTG